MNPWIMAKFRKATIAALDRFIKDLEAEAENGSYIMPGENHNDKGHLLHRAGISRDDALRELLRRVKAHRRRAKRQRSKTARPWISKAS